MSVHLKEVTNEAQPTAGLAKSELRRDRRHKIYISDAFRISVTTMAGSVRAHLLDLSADGLAFAVADADRWAFFKAGEHIEYCIDSASSADRHFLLGVVVYRQEFTSQQGNFLRVGVKTVANPQSILSRRRATGFHAHQCPEFFRPLAYCSDPLLFGETLHFQIDSWMPNGCVARTSSRNNSVFPGQTTPLVIFVPTQGEFTVDCRVVDVAVHPEERNCLRVEFAFSDPGPKFLAAIGEFVLTYNAGVTLRQLKKEGFFLDTVFKALRLGYPTGVDDWQSILGLRLRAYHSVNKLTDKSAPDEMADRYDAYSRQIVARAGGKIVGAARVVFCGHDREKSENANYGLPVPEWVFEKGCVEFSRFCTDTEWRGGDIFIALMQHASLLTWNSGAECILANCNPDLWKVYSKLGFRKVAGPFSAYGRDDCYLIVCRPRQTIGFGRGSGVMLWNQTLLDVHEYGARNQRWRWLMELNPWIHLQRVLAPAVAFVRRHSRFKKLKKLSKRQ